jgi:3-oxoacyl-[acyl-carrier protein] reductase
MTTSGLKDRVVIVTGGVDGIGRAVAVRFAEHGARIACWDVSDAGADDWLREIAEGGGEGLFLRVDVANAESVRSATRSTVSRFGRIDVLVNNAGIVRDAQLVKWKDGALAGEMSDQQWNDVIGVNLSGVFFCTRAVVPHMIASGGGAILNASSIVALYGNFGQTNYTGAKAALIGMTRTWARELGRYGIRVNAIAPGFIATRMVTSMPEQVRQSMVERTPLGRAGTPEEVAEAYVWLASSRASFVTGAVLSVDGGLVIGT